MMSEIISNRKRAGRTVAGPIRWGLVLFLLLPVIGRADSSRWSTLDPVTRGRLELAEGQLRQARTLCREALQGKQRAEALACIGEIALARGQFQRALQLGLEALKVRGSIAVRLLLAVAHLNLGNCQAATAHLEQVLFVDPDHYQAQQTLDSCRAQAASIIEDSP